MGAAACAAPWPRSGGSAARDVLDIEITESLVLDCGQEGIGFLRRLALRRSPGSSRNRNDLRTFRPHPSCHDRLTAGDERPAIGSTPAVPPAPDIGVGARARFAGAHVGHPPTAPAAPGPRRLGAVRLPGGRLDLGRHGCRDRGPPAAQRRRLAAVARGRRPRGQPGRPVLELHQRSCAPAACCPGRRSVPG